MLDRVAGCDAKGPLLKWSPDKRSPLFGPGGQTVPEFLVPIHKWSLGHKVSVPSGPQDIRAPSQVVPKDIRSLSQVVSKDIWSLWTNDL